jgi:hypothetical protein
VSMTSGNGCSERTIRISSALTGSANYQRNRTTRTA